MKPREKNEYIFIEYFIYLMEKPIKKEMEFL
jgi:hypothetical protein